MDHRRRRLLRSALAALSAAALPRAAAAQVYPHRRVRLIVGFPAGGPVDIAGRLIAAWLSKRSGQPIDVENVPGESGNTATRSVVRAAPDGYTLLVCGPVNAINTTLFESLDFDFGRDIVAVAGLYSVPLVIEVNPSVPARTVMEFISYAKTNPGRLRVGFAGVGTPQHIGIELFKSMAGVDLTLVPYLGSTPALEDLLAGRIDAMFDPMPSSIAHVRAGRLVPLAVTGTARSDSLPDVPVAADTVKGYQAGSWFGIGAPKGTPMAVVGQLNGLVDEALNDDAIKSRLAGIGASSIHGSPAEFAKFIADETEKYAVVVRSAGLNVK
ncbi:Bug family tripartite tricarboxylate transporter substrate binding protein [Bradyrhizobium sp. P5_C12]